MNKKVAVKIITVLMIFSLLLNTNGSLILLNIIGETKSFAVTAQDDEQDEDYIDVNDDAIQYIYKNGNQYTDITGGWVKDWSNTYNGRTNCFAEFYSQYMRLYSGNNNINSWSYQAIRTNNMIDLSYYDTMTIVFDNIAMTNRKWWIYV